MIDIAEMLLKVALKHQNLINQSIVLKFIDIANITYNS
jgi:hypothetical protein